MASWLQAQLKVAEGLLDAVDKSVSKNLIRNVHDGDPADDATSAPEGNNAASGQSSTSGRPSIQDWTLVPPQAPSSARQLSPTPPHQLAAPPARDALFAAASNASRPSAAPAYASTLRESFSGHAQPGPIPFRPINGAAVTQPVMSGASHTSSATTPHSSTQSSVPAPWDARPLKAAPAAAPALPRSSTAAAAASHPPTHVRESPYPTAAAVPLDATAPSADSAAGTACPHLGGNNGDHPPTGPVDKAVATASGAVASNAGPTTAYTMAPPGAPLPFAAASSAAPRPTVPFSVASGSPSASPAPAVDVASNRSAPVRTSSTAPSAVLPASTADAARSGTAEATNSSTRPVSAAVAEDNGTAVAAAAAAAFDDRLGSGPSFTGAAVSAPSGSQSAREQQLAVQLRRRIDQLKMENEQLEDMLHQAEQRASQEAAEASRLAGELRLAAESRAASEAALQAQVTTQQAAVRDVAARLEAVQRTALRYEAEVAALQETNTMLAQSKSELEGGMLEALKSEVAAAEQRVAAEHRAHLATRAAAAARERDLEHHLADSSAAFARAQRSLEESTARGREFEEQLALLESARAELAEQVQRAGLAGGQAAASTSGGGNGGTPQMDPKSAGRQLNLDAMAAEVQQQRRAATAAEAARAAAEVKLAEATRELEALRETLAGHQDTSALEAQLREVSDMLLIKQSQLERLAGDKAAQQLRLERELHQARDEAARLRAGGAGAATVVTVGGGSAATYRGGTSDLIPMDALGEPYRRLTRNRRVGRAFTVAANALDSTAAALSFFLRQYPLGRLAIFGYLLLVHLWMYLLIAQMQRQAVSLDLAAAATQASRIGP